MKSGLGVRPVLFLDVDGVLNSMTWFAAQPPTSVTEVDPKAVQRIRRVVLNTRAYVVLSSSWRKKPGFSDELEEKLIAAGLPIDDRTPWLSDGTRGDEIRAWLVLHPETTTFAIIDDDADAGEHYPDRFVRTYTRNGMYGKHEKALVALLNTNATASTRSGLRFASDLQPTDAAGDKSEGDVNG